ncbi:ABC transporter permease [Acidobacteriota bacterium]
MTFNHRKPPVVSLWLLKRMSRDCDRKTVQSDFTEIYEEVMAESGGFRAICWYWLQFIRSIPMLVLNQIFWGYVMLKNYFKITFRNILRHKLYSAINIIGLSVGMFCFLLIFLWVNYEKSYDRYHDNSKDLYQVVYEYHGSEGDVRLTWSHASALGEVLKNDYPEIKNSTRSLDSRVMTLGTEDITFLEKVNFVDPSFLEMFSIRFIEGDPKNALSQPNSILLTESVAAKHFVVGEAVGKKITLAGSTDLLVTGVIEEMPKNSHFKPMSLVPLSVGATFGWKLEAWGEQNYRTYIQLHENISPELVSQKIRNVYQNYNPDKTFSKVSIRPITKIHLYDLNGGGLITYVYIFSILAIFILIIAIINFMNLSTARSSLRAKEVGVRKTIGANRVQIFKQLLGESILVAFVALLFSGLLVRLFLPRFNRLVEAQIQLNLDGQWILLLAGTAVLTGILAGIYPALALSSFPILNVLKGIFKHEGGMPGIRKFLVTFQFAVSIFMIIGMLVIVKQLKFIKSRDLGFNQENLICLRLTNEINQNFSTIKSELLRNPEIISLCRTNHTLDQVRSTTSSTTITWEGQSDERDIGTIHVLSADQDFVDTFGIEMAEGRFFSEEFPSDPKEAVVLNQTAVKAIGLESPIGKRFSLWGWPLNIIGVMSDFNFYTLQTEIQPVVMVMGRAGLSELVIKVQSQDLPQIIGFIKNEIKDIVPGYSPDYQLLDEKLNEIYKSEQRMSAVTSYLTFLAIFLSCLGMLGLASFITEQRTKEIGIRRVLGASGSSIVWLLFSGTAKWVLTANLIAWPSAYLIIRLWLQSYAYRTGIDIKIFFLSSIATLMITFITISYLTVKAACANPVDALRYE